jgi:hypothetical protein
MNACSHQCMGTHSRYRRQPLLYAASGSDDAQTISCVRRRHDPSGPASPFLDKNPSLREDEGRGGFCPSDTE